MKMMILLGGIWGLVVAACAIRALVFPQPMNERRIKSILTWLQWTFYAGMISMAVVLAFEVKSAKAESPQVRNSVTQTPAAQGR